MERGLRCGGPRATKSVHAEEKMVDRLQRRTTSNEYYERVSHRSVPLGFAAIPGVFYEMLIGAFFSAEGR